MIQQWLHDPNAEASDHEVCKMETCVACAVQPGSHRSRVHERNSEGTLFIPHMVHSCSMCVQIRPNEMHASKNHSERQVVCERLRFEIARTYARARAADAHLHFICRQPKRAHTHIMTHSQAQEEHGKSSKPRNHSVACNFTQSSRSTKYQKPKVNTPILQPFGSQVDSRPGKDGHRCLREAEPGAQCLHHGHAGDVAAQWLVWLRCMHSVSSSVV